MTIIEQKGYNPGEIRKKISCYFKENDLIPLIKNRVVMLKVSLVFPVGKYERVIMINTNYNLIAGVAFALEDLGARKVYIADGETLGPASYACSTVRLKKYLRGLKRTEFLYLDEVPRARINFRNSPIDGLSLHYPACLISGRGTAGEGGGQVSPETLKKKFGYIDFFISLPKLKANIFADITLSVKNNMGLIPMGDRLRYHNKNLHDMIACLYTVRPPDLVITDAVVSGMGQGPMEADPCMSGMIIAGRSGLAVDTACAYLMDYDPRSVRHLEALEKWGYGSLDIKRTPVKNRNILEERRGEARPFKLPDIDLNNLKGLKVFSGEDPCQPGCLGMLKTILEGYVRNTREDLLEGFTVILGNADIPKSELNKIKKRKCIVYGNCAVKKYKKYGASYKGCPPDYLRAMFYMQFQSVLGFHPWIWYVNVPRYFWSFIRHFFALMRGARLFGKV